MKHIKYQLFSLILSVLVVISTVLMPVGGMASEPENILRKSGAVSSITTSIPTRNEEYHPVTAMIDGIMTGDNRYKSENTLDRVDDLVITISLSENYNISGVKIFERWMEEYGSCSDEITIAAGTEGNMITAVADGVLNTGTESGQAVESVYDFVEAISGDKIIITFKGGKTGRAASDSQYEIWEIEAFGEKIAVREDILNTETVASITTSIQSRNEEYHPATAMLDGLMSGDAMFKSEAANGYDNTEDVPGVSKPLTITIKLKATYELKCLKIYERYLSSFDSNAISSVKVGVGDGLTTVAENVTLDTGDDGETVATTINFTKSTIGDTIEINFVGGLPQRGDGGESQYQIWELEAFGEIATVAVQGNILNSETVDNITTSIQSRNEEYHPATAMIDGVMTGDAMFKSEAANGYDNTTDIPGVSKPLTITFKLKDAYELGSLKIYENYLSSFESNIISSVKVGFTDNMTTVAENVTLSTGEDGVVATTINFDAKKIGDTIEINFAGGLPERGDGGESQYQIWEIEAYTTAESGDDGGNEPGGEGGNEPGGEGGDQPGDEGGDIVIPGPFQPVAGVGDPTVKLPAATVDGTVIYEKNDFTSDIYNTSDIKQLDPILFSERGTSIVSENGNTGSCFMFGKQGYFTLKNALDAYVAENGNVVGNIHELVFDMKFESASVYLYPCGGGNNRDAEASLVISGTTLTNDDDGAVYGNLPSGRWYQIKYTYDVGNTMLYISVNNAVVYQGKSTTILKNFYSILYQQGDDTKFYIDNIKYTVKGNLEITDANAADYKVEAIMSGDILTNVNGEDIDFKKLIELYCGDSKVELKSVDYDIENRKFVLNTKTPVFSGMTYSIGIDNAVKSIEGVNIRNNYFYDFQTPCSAFDISDVTKTADKITATVINTSGDEETIVMAVIGKSADGTITSAGSTAKIDAENGVILEYSLTDTNAVTYEVFFIKDWESCVPVKGAIYKLS